jgi:hypothetical protein
MVRGSIAGRGKIFFLFSKKYTPIYEARSGSCSMGTGVISYRIKETGA